jgi:hypothetical protein
MAYYDSEAMKTLNEYVKDGDVVALHNFNSKSTAYIEKDITIIPYSENSTATYIASCNFTTNYTGYRLIGEYPYLVKKTILSGILQYVGLSTIPKNSDEIFIKLWQRVE